MRIENWCGYDIRFVEVEGEWYAILKDICDALHLKSKYVAQRLESNMLMRVPVEGKYVRPLKYYKKNSEVVSNDLSNSDDLVKDVSTYTHTYWMLAVNELGVYEALFASRRLEARKFRIWTAEVMRKLRKQVGLQGYEVMKMTEPEIQADIDFILDTLFYDPETGMVMQSVTVQGGDVEQVPYLG